MISKYPFNKSISTEFYSPFLQQFKFYFYVSSIVKRIITSWAYQQLHILLSIILSLVTFLPAEWILFFCENMRLLFSMHLGRYTNWSHSKNQHPVCLVLLVFIYPYRFCFFKASWFLKRPQTLPPFVLQVCLHCLL